jgi:UPF0716 protein FxsA
MRFGLLLAVLAFPLIELALLIRAGQIIGVWATLGIVIATAILGLLIIRWQGFTVVRRIMTAAREGRSPAYHLVDSATLFLAGGLLVTPGLIADAIGILLLVPWVRYWIGVWLTRNLALWGSTQVRVFRTRRSDPAEPQPPGGKGPIIEVDFKRIDREPGER